MHGEKAKKAAIKNTWLLAVADGRIQPEERAWLNALVDAVGTTQEVADVWISEMRHGELHWEVVDDRGEATELLRLAVGVVSADRIFARRERDAFVALGKALGFELEELRAILREAWEKDVLAELSTSAAQPADGAVVVLTDDFGTHDAFVGAAGELPIESCALEQLSGQPALIIAHACPERTATVERVRELQRRFPSAGVIVVVRRDQAHHVSYALENGAVRCMVEPIYPGELERLLARL